MKFRGLALSIFLTVALVACGQKKATTLELRYGSKGLIISSLVEDRAPVTGAGTPYAPGERLLRTAWGQGSPFNSTLPLVNNEKPIVGCVNTAMAQLLYYYQYPTEGRGIVFGQLASLDQWADLNQPIHWSLIKHDHRTLTSSAGIEEFGELFRKMALVNKTSLGISANGGSSTSTNLMIKNLVKHYGFSDQIKEMNGKAGSLPLEIINFIKNEIDQKRPLFLAMHGSLNHLALIDGYQEVDGQFQVHLNMGWEGLHDKFYSLDQAIEVKEIFERNDGSTWQRILSADEFTIYGQITPCRDDCYNDKEASDTTIDNHLSGHFESSSDVDTFGPFPGSRNYSFNFRSIRYTSNPYYVTVVDRFGQIIEESTKPFQVSAMEDFYVRISPTSALTDRYYQYEGDYNVAMEYLGPSATRSTPKTFKLRTSIERFVLKPDENEVIRLSLSPFAPGELKFKVTSSLMNDKFYSLEKNLLTLQGAQLTSGMLNTIEVEAYANNEIVAKAPLEVFVSDFKFAQGKNQSLRGKFRDAGSIISLKAALQGKCVIRGDRGFSNQAFYIQVNDTELSDESFESNFELGIYTLHASLKKGYSSYPFREEHSNFEIMISCPDANYTLSEILDTI